jgi:hypothetical protein
MLIVISKLLSGQIEGVNRREDHGVLSYARKKTLWAAKPFERSVTI